MGTATAQSATIVLRLSSEAPRRCARLSALHALQPVLNAIFGRPGSLMSGRGKFAYYRRRDTFAETQWCLSSMVWL